MKKSEFTQLTQIIEHLVRREIRKQLPTIIKEALANSTVKQPIIENVESSNEDDFKLSMRELFAGATPVTVTPQSTSQTAPPAHKHFTKNPIINEILNQTKSDLMQRERLVGSAAYQGGYSPSLSMIPGFDPSSVGVPMNEDAPFTKNMPAMRGSAMVPISKPPMLADGQVSSHAPMAEIPQGISVLDVAKQVPIAAPVAQALTRNYSQMMKLIDKKRGKV